MSDNPPALLLYSLSNSLANCDNIREANQTSQMMSIFRIKKKEALARKSFDNFQEHSIALY